MSKLNELINKLCPNGVQFLKTGDVFDTVTDYTAAGSFADIARNVKYRNEPGFAMLIRTTDIKNKFEKGGFVYIDEHAFNYLWRVHLESESLVLPNIGNCGEAYYLKPETLPYNKCALAPNSILVRSSKYNMRYLFHVLQTKGYLDQLAKITSPSGQTKFNKTDFKNIKIPIPPVEVQDEIVRILDNFTKLTAELTAKLTAELTAREKQYEYYKDELFESIDKKHLVKLGSFASIIRGGNFQKKDFVETGYPCIHYGQMYTHFGIFTYDVLKYLPKAVYDVSKKANKKDIIMAITSENVEDVCKCVAWLGEDDIAVSGHTAIIKHSINAKYLSYFFHSNMFFKQKVKLAHGTKVIEVTPDRLLDILVPVPSTEEQERIVKILDSFDSLTSDISIGIPSEIDGRTKQYEYYRDKLLTFKELEA